MTISNIIHFSFNCGVSKISVRGVVSIALEFWDLCFWVLKCEVDFGLVESVVARERGRHIGLSQERRAQEIKPGILLRKAHTQKFQFLKRANRKNTNKMRKSGQKSTGGKAPPKTVYWPPRLHKREMEDVENRSIRTQTENPTTSVTSQTHASTSDQQFQVEASTRDEGCQAKWVCRNRPAKHCSCKDGFSSN